MYLVGLRPYHITFFFISEQLFAFYQIEDARFFALSRLYSRF